MIRYRFIADLDDPRPIKFPPPGPYWITGSSETHSVVVAYLPAGVPVTDYWPEAAEIDESSDEEPRFSSRFPKPDWWTPTPSTAEQADHFLTAYASKDGKVTGINHPTDAKFADVLTAHMALRDWLNERIAEQKNCPFHPSTTEQEEG